VEYRAAALRVAARPDEARAFLEFLSRDAARAVLAAAGFEVP
jgi:ABC-type molybdate transport system substrate-binding protein